mgnify:CR=1 FL=1
MKAQVYNQSGKETKEIELPENIFGLPFNSDLVSQVLHIQRSNQRAGTANTKDRGEVAGSMMSPPSTDSFKGSKRSPIWRHGGVTHGPSSDKNYKKTLTKSMRNQALFCLLSSKLKEGKLFFIDEVKVSTPKTKSAVEVMKGLSQINENLVFKKKENVYMTFPKLENGEKRSFRNIPYVTAHNVEDLNPIDVANVRYLVITNPEATVEYLNNKLK